MSDVEERDAWCENMCYALISTERKCNSEEKQYLQVEYDTLIEKGMKIGEARKEKEFQEILKKSLKEFLEKNKLVLVSEDIFKKCDNCLQLRNCARQGMYLCKDHENWKGTLPREGDIYEISLFENLFK